MLWSSKFASQMNWMVSNWSSFLLSLFLFILSCVHKAIKTFSCVLILTLQFFHDILKMQMQLLSLGLYHGPQAALGAAPPPSAPITLWARTPLEFFDILRLWCILYSNIVSNLSLLCCLLRSNFAVISPVKLPLPFLGRLSAVLSWSPCTQSSFVAPHPPPLFCFLRSTLCCPG